MEYFIFGILCVLIAFLTLKVYLLHKGLKEIDNSLENILSQDTNRQITLSSRDRSVCRLASRLNIHLGQLRKSQLKYTNGDRELKEAITNISHDLRTPLTVISGYLELLENEFDPGETCFYSKSETCFGEVRFCPEEETLRCLEIIRNRTEHMKQLTEELFRYSLALSVPREPPQLLSLNRTLEECLLSFYESLRKKGITPSVSMPEEPVMRTLDPAALSRIFQNILGNAVKYSGGDLEVCLTEDGTVICSNTAPNLNPLLVEQLFDRYYTVQTVSSPCSESSTGLGLSIARLLTEQMGGVISASCIQNPGATLQSSSRNSSNVHASAASDELPTGINRLEITIRFPA